MNEPIFGLKQTFSTLEEVIPIPSTDLATQMKNEGEYYCSNISLRFIHGLQMAINSKAKANSIILIYPKIDICAQLEDIIYKNCTYYYNVPEIWSSVEASFRYLQFLKEFIDCIIIDDKINWKKMLDENKRSVETIYSAVMKNSYLGNEILGPNGVGKDTKKSKSSRSRSSIDDEMDYYHHEKKSRSKSSSSRSKKSSQSQNSQSTFNNSLDMIDFNTDITLFDNYEES